MDQPDIKPQVVPQGDINHHAADEKIQTLTQDAKDVVHAVDKLSKNATGQHIGPAATMAIKGIKKGAQKVYSAVKERITTPSPLEEGEDV